jgi:hypothetical protein
VDSVPLSGSGSQRIARAVLLPGAPQIFTVDIRATIVSDVQTLVEEDSVHVGSPDAPSLSYTVQPDDNIEPGDTIRITLSASAVHGLQSTRVIIAGAWAHDDSIAWHGAFQGTQTDVIKIPANVVVGGAPLGVYLRAVDLHGLHTQGSISLTVSDTHAPQLTYVYSTPAALTGPGGIYVPGDTGYIGVGASDNHRLTWIGWRLGGPFPAADSFAVNDSIANNHHFAIPITQGLMGDTIAHAFARDANGHLTDTTGAFAITALSSRPVSTLSVNETFLKDLVLDDKRGVAYISQYGSSTIQILSLTSGTLQPPMHVPAGYDQAETFAMGLSPSGDSLILSLRDTVRARFAFVSLIDGTVDSLFPLNSNGVVANISVNRIAPIADGRAVLMLNSDYPYVALLTYATNRWALSAVGLHVYGTSPSTNGSAIAFAGGTRAAVSLSADGANCTQLVTASPLAFAQCSDKGVRGQLSATADGSRVVIWPVILNSTLATVGRFAPVVEHAVPQNYSSVITPDGQHIYAALWNGHVIEMRGSDGAITGGFQLPSEPKKMAITADGKKLIAIVGSTIYIVDLS